MNYTNILKINERYQSSINLKYDIGDLSKIDCYIPTEKSVKIIGRYLRAIVNKNTEDFSTVLIGPYGKGKSHLLLVLLSLVASNAWKSTNKQWGRVSERLIKRIDTVDPAVGTLARDFMKQGKPLLPVVIDSNSSEINQVLIVALRDALERAGCEDLLPQTNFTFALDMLQKWKEDYPDAFGRLENELRAFKKTVEQLSDGLATYDKDSYDIFVKVYPVVTAGSPFAPMFTEDAVELYKAVNVALNEQTPYGGMFIVYDEFSKFVEANLDKSKMMNFKAIQQLAELATRSKEPQMHFCCVTHKELLDYANSDSFKTVEGRFKKIFYIQSSSQTYELVANAIEKEKSFTDFYKDNKDRFDAALETVFRSRVFESLPDKFVSKVIVKGCFPLAPVTTFCLLRVSEKVAQNERTLFTFLAGGDVNSARNFAMAERSAVEFMTVDYLYDYFADTFSMEPIESPIRSAWAKANGALQAATTKEQKKIIKAMAIIFIVGDDSLRANTVQLQAALMMDDKTFAENMTSLCEAHVITKRDISGEFAFLTANGVNIKKSLQQHIAQSTANVDFAEVLENVAPAGFVLPRQYNNAFKIIRYFKRVYMSANLFCTYKSGEAINRDYPYDGVVIQVLAFSDEEAQRARQHYRDMPKAECVLLVLSGRVFNLEYKLREYLAVQDLKARRDVKNDHHYAEELAIYEEDLVRYIQTCIGWEYAAANPECEYLYKGEVLRDVIKEAAVSRKVSSICSEVYHSTPIINNELINKTELTGQLRKARAIVSQKLLDTEMGCLPELEGYGPEVSVFRSTILLKNIRGLQCDDHGLESVLNEIDAFFQRAIGQRISLEELYDVLLKAPYRVRKGVIPVYVAYALRRYLKQTSIYWDGRETPVDAPVLERINDKPNEYEILIDVESAEKDAYLENIMDIFGLQNVEIYRMDLIVAGMQRWVRALPRVAKDAKEFFTYTNRKIEAERIERSITAFRTALQRQDVNPRELLFITLPEKVFRQDNLKDAGEKMREAQAFLSAYTENLNHTLIDFTKQVFMAGYRGSLVQAITLWRDGLSDVVYNHIFDTSTNGVLYVACNVDTQNDERILSQLVMGIENLAVEDWNQDVVGDYCAKLEKAVEEIEAANHAEVKNDDSALTISITNDGENYDKYVAAKDISQIGKTLFNNLKYSMEEYGDSISPDEKVAILLKMLKEVMGER